MVNQGKAAPTTTYQVNRAKVSDGQSVRVVVPKSTTVEVNNFYELDGFFGPSFQTVITGSGETAEAILNIEQAEYETDQITVSEEFEPGDLLYFKGSKFTVTALGARLVGRVTNGKDENNVIWFILGPQVVKGE